VSLTFDTPVKELPKLPRAVVKACESLQLQTVGDLVRHYPRRYEDRSRFDPFPRGATVEPVMLHGKVTETRRMRYGKGGRFEADFEPLDAALMAPSLTLVWFNLPFIHRQMVKDVELIVRGKTTVYRGRVTMAAPEFEEIDEGDDESIHFRRITPVHPAGGGQKARRIRALVHQLLQAIDWREVRGHLPERPGNGLPFAEALRGIHFPDDWEQLEAARRRLALEELVAMQMPLLWRRARRLEMNRPNEAIPRELVERFHATLPFTLTEGQSKTLAEIEVDMQAPHPMNRLLQGDVGAGKTVVAFSAMLLAVASGGQAALMAPTQILAEQHYLSCQRWLESLGIRCALWTGNRKQVGEAMPLFEPDATDERPGIIIGTHALLYEHGLFDKLRLIVIDEQHRFGVAQRAELQRGGEGVDVLVMTATPIPRTLSMTLYGDLDVSVIPAKPAGRGKIRTRVRSQTREPELITFLKGKLEEGRQIYLVCPLVEDSAKVEASSAKSEFEKWREWLAPHAVGLLHGRVDPREKESTMQAFRDGQLRALVATTVIEVGIDVPNATVMVVQDADRFGLAQLHQLRGRVGRGSLDSDCILMTRLTDHKENPVDPEAEEALAKLRVLEKSEDGFEIAEHDLRLRGAGDLLGTAQSGASPLKLADLVHDWNLLTTARELALDILDKDPRLTAVEHAPLKGLVEGMNAAGFSDVS